ncbi:MAG: Uma2 family endonuclease [Anaerolineae bacterium]|nr:Uma2 family endonuclease [Anaerolineae bacterium]
MVAQLRLYTAGDLWEMSRRMGDRERLELVKGEIQAMTPSGGRHGEVAIEIGAFIRTHVKSRQLGRVTGAETGYILSTDPDTVRAPDVGFVSSTRAPGPLPESFIPYAPDLAVEVVSPHDTATKIHQKVVEYLRAGTQLVWVLYPESRTVAVHTSDGAHTLTEENTLDGGDVLPGFSVPVREIFPE